MSREAREQLEALQMELRAKRGSAPGEELRARMKSELVTKRVELERQVERMRRQVRALEDAVAIARRRPLQNQPSRLSAAMVLVLLYVVVAVPLVLFCLVFLGRHPVPVLLGVAGFGGVLAWKMLRPPKNETAATPKSSGRRDS